MHIIDNFLDEADLVRILDVVNGLDFPWFYRESSLVEGIDKVSQFTHIFYTDGRINSHYYELLMPLLRKLEDRIGYKISRIHRIKANMLVDQHHKKENIELAKHKDTPIGSKDEDCENWVSLLYYLEDSDGATLVYKGDEIIERVTPKRNRAFVFKSKLVHNATPPKKHSTRKVINFVLELES